VDIIQNALGKENNPPSLHTLTLSDHSVTHFEVYGSLAYHLLA